MILYTPFPPQVTVAYTPEQMARLDRRFGRPGLLRGDPAPLLHDSARLLGAALTLRTRGGEWQAQPGEALHFPALGEARWAGRLGLTARPAALGRADLGELVHWRCGVVTVFTVPEGRRTPVWSRALDLGSFLDRLELEFMVADGCPGVSVLRAHRLQPGGELEARRADLSDHPERAGTRTPGRRPALGSSIT